MKHLWDALLDTGGAAVKTARRATKPLRARGTRDARRLTWAHNAEITAGVYREAIEHWRKEHAQAGH